MGKLSLRQLTGKISVPTFDIDGQVMSGFSAGWIKQAITTAARRRVARN